MLCKIFSKMTHLIAWNNKIDVPVGDDFFDSRRNTFEEGDDDKNHGVPTGPITQPKAKKIQQAFILHLQNWIG